MAKAVFAGTFDPITNGHIDILKKALDKFDEVVVLIAINPDKVSTFSVNVRKKMIKEAIKDNNLLGASVAYTEGLTVMFAKSVGAKYLVRGLRDEKDLPYEYKIRDINKELDPSIETIFINTSEETKDISSTKVKEMIANKEDISNLVPQSVINYMNQK